MGNPLTSLHVCICLFMRIRVISLWYALHTLKRNNTQLWHNGSCFQWRPDIIHVCSDSCFPLTYFLFLICHSVILLSLINMAVRKMLAKDGVISPGSSIMHWLFLFFQNSDPLYAAFHDEEWGVPVHDDKYVMTSFSCWLEILIVMGWIGGRICTSSYLSLTFVFISPHLLSQQVGRDNLPLGWLPDTSWTYFYDSEFTWLFSSPFATSFVINLWCYQLKSFSNYVSKCA